MTTDYAIHLLFDIRDEYYKDPPNNYMGIRNEEFKRLCFQHYIFDELAQLLITHSELESPVETINRFYQELVKNEIKKAGSNSGEMCRIMQTPVQCVLDIMGIIERDGLADQYG